MTTQALAELEADLVSIGPGLLPWQRVMLSLVMEVRCAREMRDFETGEIGPLILRADAESAYDAARRATDATLGADQATDEVLGGV